MAIDFAADLGIAEEPDPRPMAARVRQRLTERGAYLWVVDNVPLGLSWRDVEARTRLLGQEHPATTVTRFNLVLTLLALDPRAAQPHVATLRRLRTRDRGSLSAVERQVLDPLDGIEGMLGNAEARDPMGP